MERPDILAPMTRILATNGTRQRLMGAGELKQNLDWWPVTDGSQDTGPTPAPKEPKATGVVRTPEKASEVVKEVRGAIPGVTEKEVDEVATTAKDSPTKLSISEAIAKIKAATSEKEVNEVVKGETRETILKVAEKHRTKLKA